MNFLHEIAEQTSFKFDSSQLGICPRSEQRSEALTDWLTRET
jgi:hypothetical protein